MDIKYNKKFLKDLSKLPSKNRKRIEKLVFEDISTYVHITDIHNLEKLKGYTNFYRIRVGDYRIGLKWEREILSFERVLHRKDIYNYFP